MKNSLEVYEATDLSTGTSRCSPRLHGASPGWLLSAVAADAGGDASGGAARFAVPEETPLAPELSLAFWRLLWLGGFLEVDLRSS